VGVFGSIECGVLGMCKGGNKGISCCSGFVARLSGWWWKWMHVKHMIMYLIACNLSIHL